MDISQRNNNTGIARLWPD